MSDGALVLAAGAGTRLGGRAKALLPIDGVTYLERITTTARAAGVETILVVVGRPHAAAVRAEAERLHAHVVENPAPERGMASSIELGIKALRGAASRIFLWPVDHPHVRVDTLRALRGALGTHAGIKPTYRGRGGHPPLLDAPTFPALELLDPELGARAVLRRPDVTVLEVDDPGVIRDIDTPEDLT